MSLCDYESPPFPRLAQLPPAQGAGLLPVPQEVLLLLLGQPFVPLGPVPLTLLPSCCSHCQESGPHSEQPF